MCICTKNLIIGNTNPLKKLFHPADNNDDLAYGSRTVVTDANYRSVSEKDSKEEERDRGYA